MNLLPDGTGWLLPPRCAARYTMGVLWRYGVVSFSYHGIDPKIKPDRIYMNIRNPYSRLRSWLRLWNTTLPDPLDFKKYVENLHTQEHAGIDWVNLLENPNDIKLPWKYVLPMSNYLTQISDLGLEVTDFVRQEKLEEDMERIGYPTQGYKYKIDETAPKNIRFGFRPAEPGNIWEPGDGQSDIDFYENNPHCADIVRAYYAADFLAFGYSEDPRRIND